MKGFLTFNRVIYEVINRLSNKFRLEETNIKKLLTGAAVMALVISVGSTTAFAAGGGRGRRRNFVDIDNDGVCDYYNTFCQFADSDGDGICDNYGSNGCSDACVAFYNTLPDIWKNLHNSFLGCINHPFIINEALHMLIIDFKPLHVIYMKRFYFFLVHFLLLLFMKIIFYNTI